MPSAVKASLTMARKKKRASTQPGGPGAMDALKRAQAKLKEMGIKLYKHQPAPAKAEKPAPEPPVPAKGAPIAKGQPPAKPAPVKAAPAKAAPAKPRAGRDAKRRA